MTMLLKPLLRLHYAPWGKATRPASEESAGGASTAGEPIGLLLALTKAS